MTRRVAVLLLAGFLVLAGAGIAVAAFHSSGRQVAATHAAPQAHLGQSSEASEQADEDAGGVHGGTVERFHSSCSVPADASLSGNWTHGDYVSAWARTGDTDQVQAAAHSPCGKPTHAGGGKSTAPGLSKAPGKATERPEQPKPAVQTPSHT